MTLVIPHLKSFMSSQLYIWCKAGVKCPQLGSDETEGKTNKLITTAIIVFIICRACSCIWPIYFLWSELHSYAMTKIYILMQSSWIYAVLYGFSSDTKIECSFTHIKSPSNEKRKYLVCTPHTCCHCYRFAVVNNANNILVHCMPKWWVVMYMARIGCYYNQ